MCQFAFVPSVRDLPFVCEGTTKVGPEAHVLFRVQVVLHVDTVVPYAHEAWIGSVIAVRAKPGSVQVHADRDDDGTLETQRNATKRDDDVTKRDDERDKT